MNKIFLFGALLLGVCGLQAATLRVNNNPGSRAEYTTVGDALSVAQDGDVIILDASAISYGDFEVATKVTVKGAGYDLYASDAAQQGMAGTKVGNILVTAPGVCLTGMRINNIEIDKGANNVVITRNKINNIGFGKGLGFDVDDENVITGCIIYQNMVSSIATADYASWATNIMITNNIIPYCYTGVTPIRKLRNSMICYNTYTCGTGKGYQDIQNSMFEHNLGGNPENCGVSNFYNDNVNGFSENEYGGNIWDIDKVSDSHFKEVDAALSATCGAFAGDSPYVLSGIASGPYVKSLEMPHTLEAGQPLNVTLTISLQ